MQGRVNYTTVGIFVVAMTLFLLLVIFWMSVTGGDKHYKTYVVYVHEDVAGLSVESPVRFNGVKIGYVESISLDSANSKLVKLKLEIEPGVPITTSTFAIINAQGITGVLYVNLKAETETAPLLTALPGKKYPVIPSRPSLLMQLSAVLPEVATQIQQLSASVGKILNAENQQSITTSLKNIATITQAFADNSKDFAETMHSLDNALANISVASEGLPDSVKQLNKTLSSVDLLSSQMTKTSDTITKTMQSGKNVIDNFSNQIMPNAQQALLNLSQATHSMNQLTEELQRDPSMLVRGRQPPSLGPGEK